MVKASKKAKMSVDNALNLPFLLTLKGFLQIFTGPYICFKEFTEIYGDKPQKSITVHQFLTDML